MSLDILVSAWSMTKVYDVAGGIDGSGHLGGGDTYLEVDRWPSEKEHSEA